MTSAANVAGAKGRVPHVFQRSCVPRLPRATRPDPALAGSLFWVLLCAAKRWREMVKRASTERQLHRLHGDELVTAPDHAETAFPYQIMPVRPPQRQPEDHQETARRSPDTTKRPPGDRRHQETTKRPEDHPENTRRSAEDNQDAIQRTPGDHPKLRPGGDN